MKVFSKKKKYNERALSIERYILKNKFFLIVVLFLIVFIIFSEINTNIESSKQTTTTTEITETEEKNEDVDTGINISEELPHWKFYSIDLWVLIIGGTVCTVNIIRERKKAKEKLQ